MAYILPVVLIAGLILFCADKLSGKTQEVGKMMFFSALIALLIALAPATIKLLQ